MDIFKIIKVYFVVSMIVMSMVAVSYSQDVRQFFASVIHIENSSEQKTQGLNLEWDTFKNILKENQRVFYPQTRSDAIVNLTWANDAKNAYAAPGGANVNVMELTIKSPAKDVLLDNLNFKVYGVLPTDVAALYLMDKNGNEFEAENEGEYFSFQNMNFLIKGGSEASVFLTADLGNGIHAGQRLRLDIEKPSDISLFVDGEEYFVNNFYPIKGKYLTIVGNF